MTVNIGYVSKYLSIIVTDRRINYGENQEFGYSDNNNKLINLKDMGWATGAGLANFLDDFKEKLSESEVKNSDDVIALFHDVVEKAKQDEPDFAEHIDKSVGMISWFSALEDLSDFFFRVGLLSNSDFGRNIALLNNEELQIVYPTEYLDDIAKVRELEKRYDMKIKFDGDLNKIFSRIFTIFSEISKESNFVSSICDVGLHFLNSEGFFKVRFSGEVEELLNDLYSGKIEERYELVSKI